MVTELRTVGVSTTADDELKQKFETVAHHMHTLCIFVRRAKSVATMVGARLSNTDRYTHTQAQVCSHRFPICLLALFVSLSHRFFHF